jgi:methionyl-tRNA formyltransferase
VRLAFLGTPAFAVPTLAALIDAGHEILVVYSQPPSPRGRGRLLAPSAVQDFASASNLKVRTPTSLRQDDEVQVLRALDLDAMVVVAFGQILPGTVLEAPRLGSFNLHASLLPRWRGAAPIQRAIMAGDRTSGVCVMRMTEGLDEGPVLACVSTRIGPLETAGTLQDRLAATGARLMVDTLNQVRLGRAVQTAQPTEGVTVARKIRPRETRIRWDESAERVDLRIRGLSPVPGGWFAAESRNGPVRIKALLSQAESGLGPPGEVLDDAFLVACGSGALRVLRAQREGKAPQEAAEFLRGFPLPRGVHVF